MRYSVGDVVAYTRKGEVTHGIIQELEDEALYVTMGVTSNYVTKIEIDKVHSIIKKRENIYITYDDVGEICAYICNNEKRVGVIIAIDIVHRLCLVRFEKSNIQIDFEDIIEIVGKEGLDV